MRWPRSPGCVAPPPRCLTCSRQNGESLRLSQPAAQASESCWTSQTLGAIVPPILQHELDDEGKSRSVRFPPTRETCPPECCPLANAELCKPQARLQFGQFFSLPASLARAPSDRQFQRHLESDARTNLRSHVGRPQDKGSSRERSGGLLAGTTHTPDASRSPISDLVCKSTPKEKLACLVRPLRSSCSSVSVD